MVVVVATMLLASSCGDAGSSGSSAAITFNIAVEDSELPAVEELLRRFQQTTGSKVGLSLFARGRNRPGPRINLSRLGADDVTKELKKDGAEIDLIAVDNHDLGSLVKDDLVQPLPDVTVPAEVVEVMRSGMRLQSGDECKPFFLPFRPNVRLTYVRKAALERAGLTNQPPRTIQELEAAGTLIRSYDEIDDPSKPPRPGVTLSLAPGPATAVTIAEWILSHGGDPLHLSDERSIAALRELDRLWRLGIFSRASLGARYDTEVDYLLSGDSHLLQNWTFTSARLAEAGKLHEFSVYEGWAAGAPEAHVIGGDVLAIPKAVKGARRANAVRLAEFLMSREAQAYLVRENAWPSIRGDAYGSDPPAQQETIAAIKVALEKGWFRPPVARWSEVVIQMNAAVDRILIQGQDVTSVMNDLQTKIDTAAGLDSHEACAAVPAG